MVNAISRPLYLRVRASVPILREAVLASYLSGRVRKFLPPPGFEPWTVHLLANRTVTCAIPAWNEGTDKKSLKPVSPYEAPSQFLCVSKSCVDRDLCRVTAMDKDPAGHIHVDSHEAFGIQGWTSIATHIRCLKCVNFATEIRAW